MLKKTLLVLVLLLTLASCNTPDPGLPFETIEQDDWPGTEEKATWSSYEPGIRVIASEEDMDDLDVYFTKDAQLRLEALNFDTYFAIAVFWGLAGRDQGSIVIQRIIQQDGIVIVYAEHTSPPGEERADKISSPYHLVKLPKESVWDQIVDFKLNINDQEIASQEVYIP